MTATETKWHLRCVTCGWYRQLPNADLVEAGQRLHDRRCHHSRYEVTEQVPTVRLRPTAQAADTHTDRMF